MPNGLDYSFVIPQSSGHLNTAYQKSISDNLNVVSSRIMHVDSNLNISSMNVDPSPNSSQPGEKNYVELKHNVE